MALPEETIHLGASPYCCQKSPLELKVLRSNAGYYIGTWCPNCGPYSRESHYYGTKEEAQHALTNNTVAWR